MTKHIAFIVESAFGHLVPTLAIARNLLAEGYRVTYAVTQEFASRIRSVGAEPLTYDLHDYRIHLSPIGAELDTNSHDYIPRKKALLEAFFAEEKMQTIRQLKTMYNDQRPDLIIYDLRNTAGKALAEQWHINAIEHSPMMVESNRENILGGRYDESLILVSVPREFQRDVDRLDERFRFIGFNPQGRAGFFTPWTKVRSRRKRVLVAGTTAGGPQNDFLWAAIEATNTSDFEVVVSVGQSDLLSSTRALPPGVEINSSSSNLDILENCDLYVGQGGHGSTFESLYQGVPVLLVPPTDVHDTLARRVEELGLGIRLAPHEASCQHIKRGIDSILNNRDMLNDVINFKEVMRNNNEDAVTIICRRLEMHTR